MKKDLEYLYPHASDVQERITSDNGFSEGWGMHFIPTTDSWIDCHTHALFKSNDDICRIMQDFKSAKADAKHIIVCTPPVISQKHENDYSMDLNKIDSVQVLNEYLSAKDDNFSYLLYLSHYNPDITTIRNCVEKGIAGIKLHNAPLMSENIDYNIWLSDEWDKAFKVIEEYNLPVLWHVTQRLSPSPYTYGGRNSYWKDGYKKGVKFTNRDLLDTFLKVVEKYPGINFIAAHQLHMGWPQLSQLLDKYPNLYTDTTIGCQLRKEDSLYPHDREFIREYFIKYSDRFLFGTDNFIYSDTCKEELEEVKANNENHMRFIKQLFLPENVLHKVSHENAERIFGL